MARINLDKLKTFVEENKGLLEQFDQGEALKQEKLRQQTELAENYHKLAEAMEKRVKFMLDAEIPVDDPQVAHMIESIRTLATLAGQANLEAGLIMTPEPVEVTGETVFFPDETEPSGKGFVVFEPGTLRRLLDDPQELVNEMTLLRESDDPASQAKLKALSQIVSDDLIARAQQSDVLSIQGQTVTQRSVNTPPSVEALNRLEEQFGGLRPLGDSRRPPLSRANSPEANIISGIRGKLESDIRKQSAQRRERTL